MWVEADHLGCGKAVVVVGRVHGRGKKWSRNEAPAAWVSHRETLA
jgi:hypothetical protein